MSERIIQISKITSKRQVTIPVEIMKKLQFVKVKCQCGYTNLIPAYENTKCEKCGKIVAEPKRNNWGNKNAKT